MLKYLDKIKLMAETASDGQECTDMVFCKEPGYYSLIIVSLRLGLFLGTTNSFNYSVTSRCPSRMAMKPAKKFATGSKGIIIPKYPSWLFPPTP